MRGVSRTLIGNTISWSFTKLKKKKNTQLRWGKREVKRPNIALWISKPETKWK